MLKSNPRELNFNLSCGAVLQKYDAERDESRAKFDLERDEAQRKFMASLLGVKLQDSPTKTPKPPPMNGQTQKMTQQDIMRNYGR
jgi:hypothetical protein